MRALFLLTVLWATGVALARVPTYTEARAVLRRRVGF